MEKLKSFADLNPRKVVPLTPAQAEFKAQRANKRKNIPDILKAHGVQFISKGSAHLVITHNTTLIDYWPGPGRWQEQRVGGRPRFGIQSLLEHLGAA